MIQIQSTAASLETKVEFEDRCKYYRIKDVYIKVTFITESVLLSRNVLNFITMVQLDQALLNEEVDIVQKDTLLQHSLLMLFIIVKANVFIHWPLLD